MVEMGKVMINKPDTTKTARSGKEGEEVPVSTRLGKNAALKRPARIHSVTDGVGAKKDVKNEEKPAGALNKVKVIPAKVSDTKKSATIKVTTDSDNSKNKVKMIPSRSMRALGAGEIKKANGAIVAKEKVSKQQGPVRELGTIVRERNMDIITPASTAPGRTGVRHRQGVGTGRPDANGHVAQVAVAKKKELEDTESLSKTKSMLIGVGVALVVAVVGFAAIALFGEKKPMCAIHYESNGGSEVEDTEIVCGRTLQQPDDPTKEGFTFEGWMYDGDPFDFENTEVYKNATLVARWQVKEGTEVVKVRFDSDGGTAVQEVELAKGGKMTAPKAPTKMGYLFDGWQLDGKDFDFNTAVSADITLKATWVKRPASNTGGNSNNQQPAVKQITSMTANVGSLDLFIGDTGTINVSVLPSNAEYALAVQVENADVVSCSVNKNTVSCTGQAEGSAVVRVWDTKSNLSVKIMVVVKSAVPPVVDPPVTPENPENPGDNTGNEGSNLPSGGDGNESGDGDGGGTNEGENTGTGDSPGSGDSGNSDNSDEGEAPDGQENGGTV